MSRCQCCRDTGCKYCEPDKKAMGDWRREDQSPAARLKRANNRIAQLEATQKALSDALEWYACEAVALNKNMEVKNGDAALASVTVLSRDNGNRAKEALAQVKSDG